MRKWSVKLTNSCSKTAGNVRGMHAMQERVVLDPGGAGRGRVVLDPGGEGRGEDYCSANVKDTVEIG